MSKSRRTTMEKEYGTKNKKVRRELPSLQHLENVQPLVLDQDLQLHWTLLSASLRGR